MHGHIRFAVPVDAIIGMVAVTTAGVLWLLSRMYLRSIRPAEVAVPPPPGKDYFLALAAAAELAVASWQDAVVRANAAAEAAGEVERLQVALEAATARARITASASDEGQLAALEISRAATMVVVPSKIVAAPVSGASD